MIFIKTKGDHLAELSPEEQQAHVQKIGKYIGGLMESGKLKGAQPLEMDGAIIHGNKGVFKDGPFNESKEVIVGYFHIVAENLEEAIEIAKANPMFDDAEATIEVRPIKQMDGIN
ncbi:YciI family protein [Flavivirga spongiicola]|uniref:YciI family protein n=1 Tax=Flavivirga spongiicola TaxID=421621 RepID=A0ABU7XUB6_9FLAO|nr:YciI family protein [Flavivirga sp. MEBiC05379]MDO5979347.1 YciI family protein [Flavivirga sp. MEBiC05379]